MKERVLLWEGRFFWKESSIIRRSSIVEKEFYWKKEVLLEKIGSLMTRKSQWKRSSFWEGSLTEILLWDCCSFVAKRSSIMRRKFGYGTRFILRTKSYYGRYFYYKKEVLLWEESSKGERISLTEKGTLLWKRKFYYEKETISCFRKFYHAKEVLLWKKSSFMRRKLYIRKIEFYYCIRRKFEYGKRFLVWEGSFTMVWARNSFEKSLFYYEKGNLLFKKLLGKFCFYWKMKSLLTLYFSIEISSFWPLSYWNPYFLTTFLLKSLLSQYFSIEISTFSLLSIEISSFWPLHYWNLDFLNTFLLKSLLSLYFSIEISTFSLLFYWNLLFLTTFLLKSLLSESSKTKKN